MHRHYEIAFIVNLTISLSTTLLERTVGTLFTLMNFEITFIAIAIGSRAVFDFSQKMTKNQTNKVIIN